VLSSPSIPQLAPISSAAAGSALESPVLRSREAASFGETLAGAFDGLTMMTARADALSAGIVAGTSSIAQAAIARAKADVLLEVAAVAASRFSSDINALMQTQI
jgi:flagellar hook-basal body complex protein FliE